MIRIFYRVVWFVVLVVALLALGSGARAAGPVTFESLLGEMIDRDALARFPAPAYTTAQASSYDRQSTTPDDPKTWFGNRDNNRFVRKESRPDGGTEYVLMDQAGPGAVVRFWSTWIHSEKRPFSDGTLRVYLDGSDTPAIEGTYSKIIDGDGLVGKPLSMGVSPKTHYSRRGHNLYLPIPYAKHCKITYQPRHKRETFGEVLYYQINYRTYAEGTAVRSFSMDQLKSASPLVEKVQQELTKGAVVPFSAKPPVNMRGILESGATMVREISGPAAIHAMLFKVNALKKGDAAAAAALRSVVLEIQFDGQRTVWCPVGSFFGMGYLLREYNTWVTRVEANGTMLVRWVMPFATSCRVTLHNLGPDTVEVTRGGIYVTPWTWDDRSMHFGATWRKWSRLQTQTGKESAKGAFDVNYVTLTGRGVYVGDTLTVFNRIGRWWGEGDEKIYVDGETFPSHFGTGTEDYYGYAWCRPEPFSAPFIAQPEGGGNVRPGFTVNDRYRSLDAIPFTEKLRVDMEVWHHAKTKIDYAPATFFYLRPGGKSNIEPDPKAAAEPPALPAKK